MTFNVKAKSLSALLLSFVLTCTVSAANIATVTISEQSIKITGNQGYSNITLTVSGPEGFYVQNFLGDGAVSMSFENISSLSDGQYNYELTAATSTIDSSWQQNNGRESGGQSYESASQSGAFRVSGGAIVTNTERMSRRMIQKGDDQDEI